MSVIAAIGLEIYNRMSARGFCDAAKDFPSRWFLYSHAEQKYIAQAWGVAL